MSEPVRAATIRPSHPSDELVGFVTDAESLCRVLRVLSGWSCVCVEDEIARRLGPIPEAGLGHPVRYIMDIYTSNGPSWPARTHRSAN
jgi:hypothetical protein